MESIVIYAKLGSNLQTLIDKNLYLVRGGPEEVRSAITLSGSRSLPSNPLPFPAFRFLESPAISGNGRGNGNGTAEGERGPTVKALGERVNPTSTAEEEDVDGRRSPKTSSSVKCRSFL
ncbi:unnamed protein product [Arabis nemorensis]|uniref:Uncharacterized protein n=1 Tax=Arabis nemorensis TaxID=586526 RepID=A0A565CX26_9BRAS|nr:unnamed protein product [Arabis nemorensis]